MSLNLTVLYSKMPRIRTGLFQIFFKPNPTSLFSAGPTTLSLSHRYGSCNCSDLPKTPILQEPIKFIICNNFFSAILRTLKPFENKSKIQDPTQNFLKKVFEKKSKISNPTQCPYQRLSLFAAFYCNKLNQGVLLNSEYFSKFV